MVGIYKITNIVNNKVYIGQSLDLERRLKTHKGELLRECHINKHLQASWNKYGEKSFTFEILEKYKDASPDFLTSREQYWINYYGGLNPEFTYNNREAGNKGRLSERSKQLVSKHNKGKTVIITEETKNKISKALKGRTASNKGSHHTKETREKISRALTGKKKPPRTEEHRINLSNSLKGKPAWNKGKKMAYKGIKRTEEQKQRMRQIHTKRRGYAVDQFDIKGKYIATYCSTMEAERQTGVCNSGIGACCRGLQKQSGGFIWKRH